MASCKNDFLCTLFLTVIVAIQYTIFAILKFILGSKARGNKTKEMYYSLLNLKMISFVLSLQALQPSMNFNIILPMGQFMPVILVILSSHPSCPSNPIRPIHLSHPSNPSHSSYPSHPSNTSHPAVLFKSKLTLDSQSSQESRIETRFLIVVSWFSILNSWKTHQTGTTFVYKWL